MVFIKQVANHIMLMNEELIIIKDMPNAKLKVVGDTLVITQKDEKAIELPKNNVGIIYK